MVSHFEKENIMKVAAAPVEIEEVHEQKRERLRIAKIPASVIRKPELLNLPRLDQSRTEKKRRNASRAATANKIVRPTKTWD